MKRLLLITGFFAAAFCTKGQDYKQIAAEYCNCYSTISDSIEPSFIPIIVKAADSTRFQAALFYLVEAQGKDYIQTVFTALTKLRKSMFNDNTEIGKCASLLNYKYQQYAYNVETKKQFFRSILAELEKSNDCVFYVAILKSIFRQEEE